jgi:hypothetical protein
VRRLRQRGVAVGLQQMGDDALALGVEQLEALHLQALPGRTLHRDRGAELLQAHRPRTLAAGHGGHLAGIRRRPQQPLRRRRRAGCRIGRGAQAEHQPGLHGQPDADLLRGGPQQVVAVVGPRKQMGQRALAVAVTDDEQFHHPVAGVHRVAGCAGALQRALAAEALHAPPLAMTDLLVKRQENRRAPGRSPARPAGRATCPGHGLRAGR